MLSSEFLKSLGLKAWVDGDKLKVAPPEKVTPEIAGFIKAHKQDIMAELQTVIYHNPYPEGTKEARIESLIQVMDAISLDAFHTVKATYEEKRRQFNPTPSLLVIEERIAALQRAVLRGHAHLEDFRGAVDEWAQKSMLN